MSSFFESDYYKYPRQQKNKLNYNAGVIIYCNKDEIPHQVLFMPYKRHFSLTLKEDLLKALTNASDSLIIVYFQGMRWAQMDLKQDLISSEYLLAFLSGDKVIPLNFNKKEENVRITFGIIACDTSKLEIMPDFGESKVSNLNLKFENFDYHFRCRDAPRTFGYTRFFLKYSAENYYAIDEGSFNY